MDGRLLATADREIRTHYPDLYSLLVVHQGAIVCEHYYHGYARHDAFDLRSATKSFTSALVGCALQYGYLSSLDMPLTALFPEILDHEVDPRKAAITVRHVLTMTAGFAWNDRADWHRLWVADDLIACTLGLPMAAKPGEAFSYNTAATQLLIGIVRRATGLPAFDFARDALFGPLEIATPCWETDRQGNILGGVGLSLTAREMAKLGMLYLDGGVWNGTPIVPAAYVRASTTAQATGGDPEEAQYGFHWWVTTERGHVAYFAAGYGGQYIFVVPDLDLVAVTTANAALPSSQVTNIRQVVADVVIPAIERDP